MELLAMVPLLDTGDLEMRNVWPAAVEDLLEIIMSDYERANTLLTSNSPVEDCAKLLRDSAHITTILGRLLRHAHILKCGARGWRTGLQHEPAEPTKATT